MKQINLEEVQEAGEGKRLSAGGYVCKYTKVEDMADKEYLYMEFDIVEGEFVGYYADLEERLGFWGGRCYRSYKTAALPMFKRMCSAVTNSNSGYIFDGGKQNADEKSLVGKLVGIVLGEEEYIGNDGSVKTRTYVARECSIDKIRSNDFKVPVLKKLEGEQTAPGSEDFMKVPAQESPF